MAKERLSWRSFAGPGAISAAWSAGTPAYYVIDSKGVIRHKWQGNPGEKALDAALERLLREAEGGGKEPTK